MYWLSSKSMTVVVGTNDQGIIVVAAPIVRRFIGQALDNLIGWMTKQGDFRIVELNNV